LQEEKKEQTLLAEMGAIDHYPEFYKPQEGVYFLDQIKHLTWISDESLAATHFWPKRA
jgi:hypothetical protein